MALLNFILIIQSQQRIGLFYGNKCIISIKSDDVLILPIQKYIDKNTL